MSDWACFTERDEERLLSDWTDRTVGWIRKQVSSAGCEGTVLGLSGGLDSAVTAALCARATPGKVLGVIMPCESQAEDTRDAELVADALNVQRMKICLDEPYASMIAALPEGGERASLARANVKPRLRMIVMYYLANLNNRLVVGTSNRDEIYIGYFTKYGDGGADLLPLANLVKAQVVGVAKYLGVPERIIARPPSAGLWPGQTDEEEIGLSYAQIDRYLLWGEADPRAAERIEDMHRRSAHKRAVPPAPSFTLGVMPEGPEGN
ncbi:MAG: NAD(+) synthase [Bacillota bacterium]